jgi:hypothetical protein
MQSAAVLLNLLWLPNTWRSPSAVLHLAVGPAAARRHRPGLRLHRRCVDAHDDVVLVSGIPCMSVTRTLVELARDPAIPMLLVVQLVDGALRQGRTTTAELMSCAGRFPGERGIARARRLIARGRPGVDSPPETTMRLMLEDGGINGIDVNIEIRDADGLVLARSDLGVRRLMIWGEYDGFDTHVQQAAFRKDRMGDRWLEGRGWLVMRFVDLDLGRPDEVCRDWRRAISEAPGRIAAMNPNRSPELAAARRGLGL